MKNSGLPGQGFAQPKNQNENNFAEMIPVISGVIGRHSTDIVSAKSLHSALGVRRDFTTWIKNRISEYGFKEGADFDIAESLSSPNPGSAKSRQQLTHEYSITLRMGKELSMVERTEQGRSIRHYFIKCEEELRRKAPEQVAALRRGQTYPKESHSDIFKAGECDISVIKFEGVKVRVVNIHGEPWFIAVDVCKALETDNPTKAVKALDADENTLTSIQGIHAGPGNPIVNAVSESGFYKLIARSRKASISGTFAHRFSNWVFREVIPSIRKTGSYGVPFAFLNDHSKRLAHYTRKASKRGYSLQSCKQEKEQLAREEKELWRKYQPELLPGGSE